MRRRSFIFIDGGTVTGGGGGGGTLLQTVQINNGDGNWNTPTYADWWRFCYNESNTGTSITNSSGTNTGWGVIRSTNCFGDSGGPTSGTATGFPAGVTQYQTGANALTTYTFNGLNNSNKYTFNFWGCTLRTYENVLGKTIWTIGSTSVSIFQRDYYGDVVTISNVSPSSGEIIVTVNKDPTYATSWWWGACVIKEYSS